MPQLPPSFSKVPTHRLKAKKLSAFQEDSQFLKCCTIVTWREWFHASPSKTFLKLFLSSHASYQLEKQLLQLARGNSPQWCKKHGATTSHSWDLRSYKQAHRHTEYGNLMEMSLNICPKNCYEHALQFCEISEFDSNTWETSVSWTVPDQGVRSYSLLKDHPGFKMAACT